MLTLAVTTSSHRGGVALLEGAALVAAEDYDGSAGHAERLFAAIDRTLTSAAKSRREIGRLACDIGPGSFTGVRVGVSAMQGIAMGLGIPVVGVTSLDAMMAAARALGHERVLALLDAKKAEVFFALSTPDHSTEPAHVAVADIGEVAHLRDEHRAVAIGEIAATLDGWVVFRHPSTDLPSAEHIGRAALRVRDPSPRSVLVPLYVRAPDAKPSVG